MDQRLGQLEPRLDPVVRGPGVVSHSHRSPERLGSGLTSTGGDRCRARLDDRLDRGFVGDRLIVLSGPRSAAAIAGPGATPSSLSNDSVQAVNCCSAAVSSPVSRYSPAFWCL